jgi:hypothetical protein
MTPVLIEAKSADTLALLASLAEKSTVAAKSSRLVGSIALLGHSISPAANLSERVSVSMRHTR